VDTGYWSRYAKAYGYELLAKHFWNNNNQSRGLHYFDAALKTDPKNKRYRYDLARGYLHAKQYPEALKLYREIYDEDPGSSEVLTALVMLYRYNGQSDSSEKVSLEAIEADSTCFIAYENLISLYLETNRTDQGLATLEKCIKIAPDVPRLYRNVSALFARIGDRDKAKLYSDKAIELENQKNR
jgi:tetratricopeptide (TPR) repeat protein